MVRSTLTALSAMVQSYVDQGALPRNVIALVERPGDEIPEDDDAAEAAKSWTVAEVQQFRQAAAAHRLHACRLMSTYGMRRSEVQETRWTRFDDAALRVRRGRVAIGSETKENLPKSRRSRRTLPPPADLAEALRSLKTAQKAEALSLGIPWSDDRLTTVDEKRRSPVGVALRRVSADQQAGRAAAYPVERVAEHLDVPHARARYPRAYRRGLERPRPGGITVHL